MIAEIIISILLLFGAGFVFIGSLGVIKLPDVYSRIHGPAKATTLGLGCLLLGSVLYFTIQDGVLTVHEILISVFLFMTAPISAYFMSKGAMHTGVADVGGEVPARRAEIEQGAVARKDQGPV